MPNGAQRRIRNAGFKKGRAERIFAAVERMLDELWSQSEAIFSFGYKVLFIRRTSNAPWKSSATPATRRV